MDHDRIVNLLHIVESTLKFPKLKSIGEVAMKELEEIASNWVLPKAPESFDKEASVEAQINRGSKRP